LKIFFNDEIQETWNKRMKVKEIRYRESRRQKAAVKHRFYLVTKGRVNN
jgi:hypothetical protein